MATNKREDPRESPPTSQLFLKDFERSNTGIKIPVENSPKQEEVKNFAEPVSLARTSSRSVEANSQTGHLFVIFNRNTVSGNAKKRKVTRAEIFDAIYKRRRTWGITTPPSGSGAIWTLNKPFTRFVNNFFDAHPDIHTVVDIGCGDWNISKHLTLKGKKYIGCDVSPLILNETKARYLSPERQFLTLDAVADELPDGDVAIVKDVCIHLSNDDVTRLLQKLKKYRYVIIQNDVYGGTSAKSAKDIPTGKFRPLDIRNAPFNAQGYSLGLEYTEGYKVVKNFFRILLFMRPQKKRILVTKN